MLQGILFDKDGTLFDFNATWGPWMMETLRVETGGDPEVIAVLAERLGFDIGTARFRRDSLLVAGTAAEFVGAFLAGLPDPPPVAEFAARISAQTGRVRQVPATDLPVYLDDLRRRGLVLGIATNDSEAPARANLAASGILDRFEFVVGADSGHGHKPEPGQLLAFCEATGFEAGRVAMVGDSPGDLIAGRAAGMITVGVLTGLALEEDLAPHADVVLPTIAGIPDWFASGAAPFGMPA